MIPRLFFPVRSRQRPCCSPQACPKKRWAAMSVRPGSGRGRDASLRTAMASEPVSGRTGQQQAAPAGSSSRRAGARHSAVGSLASSARLPCPVPVWQCACLPWTSSFRHITAHSVSYSYSSSPFMFCSLFLIYLKKLSFLSIRPPSFGILCFHSLPFSLSSLSSFPQSPFFSLPRRLSLALAGGAKKATFTRTSCAETEEEALWPLINGVRSHGRGGARPASPIRRGGCHVCAEHSVVIFTELQCRTRPLRGSQA